MNILVCIKQVPETDARIDITGGGSGVSIAADAWRMNRYDACALECALAIKASAPGPVAIHAVTVGPIRADAAVRRAVGMGADAGVHLVSEAGPFSSPDVVVGALADHARGAGYDLILCGVVSEDLMQGVTGPMLAECLGLPAAGAVMAVRPRQEGGVIDIEKEVDGGARVAMALTLPALLTIQTGIYQPRYPALSRLLRAEGAVTTHRLTAPPTPRQRFCRVDVPETRISARFLGGSLAEKARDLVHLLAQRGVL